jgi:HEAT repeat protein
LSEDAVSVVLAQLRRRYGEAARYALIAYLRPLLTTGTAAQRETAAGLLARLEDAAAWGRPLTDGERAAARRVLKSGTGQLRGDAARVFLDDPAAATKCPDELLALLGSDDADLRRAAAVALGRATSLSDALHLALAKAARDDAQAVREAASVTLAKLGFVPQAAGLELARSFLARLTWANAQDRTAFAARLYPLLAKLAPTDETWFTPLVAAATGTTPTDATDADIAKLLELHRKFPGRAIGDLVPLLCHATYGPVVEAILVSAPDEAYKPLLEGLKAATPGVRAAAAKVLAKTAALRNGGNHWRETLDALTALAKNDPNTDVRIIASAEAKRLAAAR